MARSGRSKHGASAWGRLWQGAGWLYLGGLATSAALVGYFGEIWPATTLALYLPRLPLLIPLAALLPALHRVGARRLLGAHVAAGLMVVGPIMGLHASRPKQPAAGTPRLRVLSYNVWYGHLGNEAIRDEVTPWSPDVVVLQAMRSSVEEFCRRDLFKGWHIESTGEFLVASRFPIVASDRPLPDADGLPLGHARYTIDSPLGLIDVYATHPMSPRPGLEALRGKGLRRVLREGVPEQAEDRVDQNTWGRERQVILLGKAAAASKHPVIIAGDTNLPERSRIYREQLARWQDGFVEAGLGYGYTYPANKLRPWLRIDRILAGPELAFTSFSVGGRGGSDHCPVIADLVRAAP